MKKLTLLLLCLFIFTTLFTLTSLTLKYTVSAQQTSVNTIVQFINKDGKLEPIRSGGVKTTLQYRDYVPGTVWKNAELVNARVEEYTGNGQIVVTGMSTDISRNLSRIYKLTIEIENTIAFEPHNPRPFEFIIKPCDLDPFVNENTCPDSRIYAVRPSSLKGDHALVDNRKEWPEIREQYVTTPGGTTPVPTVPGGFNPTATITTGANAVLLSSQITFTTTYSNFNPGGTTGLIFVALFDGTEVSGCREVTQSPQEFTVSAPQRQGTFRGVIALVTDLNRAFCNASLSRTILAEKPVSVLQANVPPPQPLPSPTPTSTPPPLPCLRGLDKEGKETTDPKTIERCTEVMTAIGSIKIKPEEFVKSIFGLLLGVSGGIAVLLIIYSAYRLITSQGNPERIQGAKETLTSAIVGLLFIIFSLVLLEAIGVDILRIPGFGR